MDTLLWLAMFGIYALAAWIWFSEFGKQFPRRRHAWTGTPDLKNTSIPSTSLRLWRNEAFRS